ncbi:Zinc finger BED domain-containing protein RICESLEEPER 2, partial [Mucuna pruriens]
NGLVPREGHIYMHYCVHILNLIVKKGIKDIDDSVLRILGVVKYIGLLPSRFMKFKECIEQLNFEYKTHIFLDVETRWNSTYLMLDATLKHKKAFKGLEFHDMKYANVLVKEKNVPFYKDWEYVDIFCEATLCIFGTSYVTSDMYMLETIGIWHGINLLLKPDNKANELKSRSKSSLKSLLNNEYKGHKEGA